MGEKRGRKKNCGSHPFTKIVKNSKKLNLLTCKGGIQIVFSFTGSIRVQKVYKDEFVHQLQICKLKKDESVTSGTGTSSTTPEFVVIYSYENKHMIHFIHIIYNLNRTPVNKYVVIEFFSRGPQNWLHSSVQPIQLVSRPRAIVGWKYPRLQWAAHEPHGGSHHGIFFCFLYSNAK